MVFPPQYHCSLAFADARWFGGETCLTASEAWPSKDASFAPNTGSTLDLAVNFLKFSLSANVLQNDFCNHLGHSYTAVYIKQSPRKVIASVLKLLIIGKNGRKLEVRTRAKMFNSNALTFFVQQRESTVFL